jgi:hypothetical protein
MGIRNPSSSDEAQSQFTNEEVERRYRSTLANVLATPPDHKTNVKLGASPKKRGRPAKARSRPVGKSVVPPGVLVPPRSSGTVDLGDAAPRLRGPRRPGLSAQSKRLPVSESLFINRLGLFVTVTSQY